MTDTHFAGSGNDESPLDVFLDGVDELKQAGSYTKAEQLLQKALIDSPQQPKLLENLADVYICQQRYKEAIDVLQFLRTRQKLSASALYLLGFSHLSINEFEQGVNYLEASNEMTGNNPEVLRNIGWAYNMMGEHQLGITLLKRALTLKPGDAYIMEDLSMAYLNAGDEKSASAILAQIQL